jgi:hypothetical protein
MNSSFNYKKKVRKPKQNKNTLDFIHKKKIESITNNKNKINEYRKKLNDFTTKYNNLCSKKKLTDEEIDSKLYLYDEINNIKESIQNIETNKEEYDYLLDVGDILFEYYENTEVVEVEDNPSINLLDYFSKKNKVSNNNNNNNISNKSKKGKLLDDYLSIIDNTYEYKNVTIIPENICEKCNTELIINYIEGISICTKCGEQNNVLIDSEKPNYKEPTHESNYFAYKRINHFNEWLSQFQAKESTDIPGIIIEKIMLELKKERIVNVANISNNKIREILKKLKLNKFYEHIPYIINKINGKPPPNISKQIEEKLRYMFKEIQNPFQNHCPKNRKNFLSYSYVIHKFIQLLGIDEYLIYFPLLKSREKLYQQDKIWKNICKDLNWEFINSI